VHARGDDRLRSLLHLATHLGAVVDAEQVARAVLTELLPVVGGTRCVVYHLTTPNVCELLAGIGFEPGRLDRLTEMPLDVPLPAAVAARTRTPLWYPTRDELLAAFPNLRASVMPADELQAVAAMPLLSRGRLIGTMAVSFAHEHVFDSDEREFFIAVADLCAQAIDRARILDEQRRAHAIAAAQSQHLAKLQAVTTGLAGASTQREVAHVIVREGRALLAADQAVFAVATAQGTLRVLDTGNVPAHLVERYEELGDDSRMPIAIAFRTCEMFVAETEDQLCAQAPDVVDDDLRPVRARAAIAAPIPGDGGARGVIAFAFHHARTISEQEKQFMADLANLAALAMTRARLFESEATARETAEQALANARDADRRKDEFLAMLGHELRNPLAPIITAVELMKLRGGVADQRVQDIIERQVKHMSRLVDDLLDVSRITRGKIELHLQRVELGTIIAKAVEQTSALLEQKAQRLAIDVAPHLELVADPIRLAQVFANLLTNAAKYSPVGASVAIEGRRVGDRAVVTVRDEGIGISSELLPNIFQIFMQAPQAISRAQGGLGLGLALVDRLVHMHRGEVVARSDGPGQGSEFEISLPLAAEQRADGAGTATHVRPACEPASVLVVDDNQDLARMLADNLEAAGHTAHVAYDGPSALQAALAAPPDVVIVDIGLPVMDGYEVCRRLREQAKPPRRMIALTGYGQPHDRDRALAAGFDVHLVKPIETHVILAALDQLAVG